MWYWGGNLSLRSVYEALASLRYTYLGSFFLDLEDIWVLGMGAIWNFAKGVGSYNLVQNMGHKGPVLRPRCIGPGRAWTHILHSRGLESDR
jgi:hypothetical protein